MKKLKFSKDEGSEFYRELIERVDRYFEEKGIPKSGGRIWNTREATHTSQPYYIPGRGSVASEVAEADGAGG